MASPFRLDDKVALITGSSRGIGLAIAQAMAEQGAKVVISSRKAPACEEAAATIRAAGGTAAVIPCNVSRRDEVEALVAGTRKAFGKIDIVVGNAAANPAYGPIGQLTDDAFDKIIGTNVKKSEPVALQSRHPRDGRARRRRRHHRLVELAACAAAR